MTVTELLAIPPAQLAALSDAELAEKLSDLIPPSRAAYVGPKTQTIRVGAKVVSKYDYERKQKQIAALLAAKGIKI